MDLIEVSENSTNRHPWETARSRVVLSMLRQKLKRGANTILDVGCGDVFLAQEICKALPEAIVYCVDTAFNDENLPRYRSTLGVLESRIRLFRNLEDLPAREFKVDALLLLDVIEHVEHDRDFFKELVALPSISTDTLFFVTAPAFDNLMTSHDHFLRHFRRYNLQQLRNLLQDVHLEGISSGYFFSSLLAVRILQKAKERMFPADTRELGVGRWTGGKLVSGLFHVGLLADFMCSSLLQRLLRVRVPGLSVFSVARLRVSR